MVRLVLGLGQTSLFSCAEPNVNEEKSFFSSFALGSAHEKSDVELERFQPWAWTQPYWPGWKLSPAFKI